MLYICRNEQAVAAAKEAGCGPGAGDLLLLIQEAATIDLQGSGVVRAAEDLAQRGCPWTADALDSASIIRLISEHHRVWVI